MKDAKLIIDWLQDLPEPQRSEAIANTTEKGDLMVDSLSRAIWSAFAWRKTDQGHDYWEAIYEDILSKENENNNPISYPVF